MKKNKIITPPSPKKIPFKSYIHDNLRIDNYHWLRDINDPDVLDYLESENEYYDKSTKPFKSIEKKLFLEIKSRINEDDSSVPYFYNDYWYITKFEFGKPYPIYVRKHKYLSSKEELLIDVNKLSRGYDYFNLKGINVSPDNSKMAFSVDTKSRRKYKLYIKDLLDNSILKTNISNTNGLSVWANDSQHLYYVKKDELTLRSDSVYLLDIKNINKKDNLIYFEIDDTFSVSISKSKSNKYIFISSHSTKTTEYQYLNSDFPKQKFKLIQKRITGLEYDVYHYDKFFFIITNHGNSFNYKLVKTPERKTTLNNWTNFLDHRDDVLLQELDLFENYWVTLERSNGLNKLVIHSWRNKRSYYVPVKGETYNIYSLYNPNFQTDKIRYKYNSLSTPNSVIEFDMKSKKIKILKTQLVKDKNFKSSNYIEKRIWAKANDGTKIPISIVHNKKTKISPSTPLLQYAYGSYGYTIDPSFSTSLISLLDRGFIYAICHVRGGDYLGRIWYEKGKLLNKKNTFEDFISCSYFLIGEGYTSSKHLYAYGGSAGGLLMGVIINKNSNLYNGIIADVPFVDVVNTMLDESIPLTTGEYDEWGNPNILEFYNYINSYSPYDQVNEQDYPNMLVTTGIHDSQVQYWEPAKWVAKIRELKTNSNLIYLVTDMKTGHGGPSGRYNAIKEVAKKYAFLLQIENQSD